MEDNIKLNCAYCNIEFEKIAKEYRRQIKNGNFRFFCTRSCSASKINTEIIRLGNPQFLIADNRKDKYTPFRWFINRANYRSKLKKKYGCNITVEYLQELWNKQRGICIFTNHKMILPQNSDKPYNKSSPYNASLDRIDNSIGYMQGNVRFISFMANIARQSFTDEQLIEFCKLVANHN